MKEGWFVSVEFSGDFVAPPRKRGWGRIRPFRARAAGTHAPLQLAVSPGRGSDASVSGWVDMPHTRRGARCAREGEGAESGGERERERRPLCAAMRGPRDLTPPGGVRGSARRPLRGCSGGAGRLPPQFGGAAPPRSGRAGWAVGGGAGRSGALPPSAARRAAATRRRVHPALPPHGPSRGECGTMSEGGCEGRRWCSRHATPARQRPAEAARLGVRVRRVDTGGSVRPVQTPPRRARGWDRRSRERVGRVDEEDWMSSRWSCSCAAERAPPAAWSERSR